MIRYEQIGDGMPKDIQVSTDDSDAEMAGLEEAFSEADWTDAETFVNIGACTRDEDGQFVFIIPGDEAAEVAEILPPEYGLEDFLDELNRKAVEDAEANSD